MAVIEVKREPVKMPTSLSDCLYCGKPLGIRRFTGTKFCSEEHARADRQELQRLMVERLRDSQTRFREQLNGRDTLRYCPDMIRVATGQTERSPDEIGPDNGMVGGPLSLSRLQVYACLTAGGSEGSGG